MGLGQNNMERLRSQSFPVEQKRSTIKHRINNEKIKASKDDKEEVTKKAPIETNFTTKVKWKGAIDQAKRNHNLGRSMHMNDKPIFT